MILRNLNVYGTERKKAIHIENGKIKAITDIEKKTSMAQDETVIEFDDAIALPGFINSHDHLDFNLFPQLGNRVYNNYTEWGKDIHERNATEINEVLKVPQSLRIKWGLYKNLLNGVTTVVNHGKKLKIEDDLINVLQPGALHSVAFEKSWMWKLNSPFLKEPVVMHIGEGTDSNAKKEIDKIIRWNFCRKKIVAVHGVAMDDNQACSFHGLIWCPASNYFLLNQTTDVGKIREKTKIVFGTDSTLTAPWNLWEHFRMAKKSGVKEQELLEMLTTEPAKLWKLNKGELSVGKDADIVVIENKNFFELDLENILLVAKDGEVNLFDESIKIERNKFEIINLERRIKFVSNGFKELLRETYRYSPELRLPYKS